MDGTACRAGLGWLVVMLAAAGQGVPALAAQGLPIDVEAGGSREVLSGDNEAWEDYWIRATVRPAPSTYAYGGVRYTKRFGEDDQQIEAGGGLPLADRWSLALDGTWSPTQRVLPIWGAIGRVTHRLNPDWSVFGGGGRRVWESTGVNYEHVGVGRHFSRVLVAYTLELHQVDIGGSGARHGLTGTASYDDRGSAITLAFTIGKHATTVAPQDIRTVTGESANVRGTHWLDRRTGIGYSFGVHRHGDFFTQSTSSIGVRHRF